MGLFILFGCGMAAALIAWARGNALRTGTTYLATIELPLACGITVTLGRAGGGGPAGSDATARTQQHARTMRMGHALSSTWSPMLLQTGWPP